MIILEDNSFIILIFKIRIVKYKGKKIRKIKKKRQIKD